MSAALANDTIQTQDAHCTTSKSNEESTVHQHDLKNAKKETPPKKKGFWRAFRDMVCAKYFKPRTWAFWRALLTAFCLCCILGHWLEWFYCLNMDYLFGIVEDDYAINVDPWYHPYWVYGFGAVGMTLGIEPLKEVILKRRKTVWGALIETFVIAVFLAMVMELCFGLIVNQPDAAGNYPYWDNSQLPGNILGQAWIVNDIFIGLAAMLYVWLIFPLICKFFSLFKPWVANVIFCLLVDAFCLCCLQSYWVLYTTVWNISV